ncbi:hypothetical protein SUGI_1479080, partial [Cryptomeria japonica]
YIGVKILQERMNICEY